MKREIKFRVFVNGKMLYSDKGDFIINNGKACINEYGDLLGFHGGSELMQFTGLKDKNDVDVYEDDICNIHVFTQELGENLGVCEGEKEFKAQIHLNELGVCLKAEYGLDPIFSYNGFHEESLEVIGNIHEIEN